jgi:hypothetical protein
MSEGTVAEAGNPVELLRVEGSLFKAYMDQNLQINAENAAAMGEEDGHEEGFSEDQEGNGEEQEGNGEDQEGNDVDQEGNGEDQ